MKIPAGPNASCGWWVAVGLRNRWIIRWQLWHSGRLDSGTPARSRLPSFKFLLPVIYHHVPSLSKSSRWITRCSQAFLQAFSRSTPISWFTTPCPRCVSQWQLPASNNVFPRRISRKREVASQIVCNAFDLPIE